MPEADQITLRMPARTDNAGLARLLAASVASRRGLSYDQVEDLRLAVDELLYCMLGDDGIDGQVEVHIVERDGSFVVEGNVQPGGPGEVKVTDLSERILGTVTDSFDIGRDENKRWFSMTKRMAT